MTTDIPATAPAPGSPEPTPNPFARIVGVFFSPDATFASIARRPDWVVPLVVLLVLSVVSGLIMAKRLDFAAPAREAMEANKNLSTEDAERMERMSASVGKVLSYAAPVFSVIIFALVAGVLLLAFRLMGGEGTFKQAFSVTLYAWVPLLILGIVTLIVILARGTFDPMSAATLVKSNPAFLVDMKEQPALFSMLSALDLFTIWSIVLLSFGFAALSKLSVKGTAAIVVSLWIALILVRVGWTALMAGQMAG